MEKGEKGEQQLGIPNTLSAATEGPGNSLESGGESESLVTQIQAVASSTFTTENVKVEGAEADGVDQPELSPEGNEENEDEGSFEDDTLSSEAVVDDIELILMPEMVQDLTPTDLSPQLVRVTELGTNDSVFREDGEREDGESDFRKMLESEDEPSISISSVSSARRRKKKGKASFGKKVSSAAQTEITALETFGKTKRLNWKSELTLLPSQTKISGRRHDESMGQDQYSPRVAKFTSQDALSSSSTLKPLTSLYRARNLSRNLNQCESYDSSRYTLTMRERMSSSTSSTFNFPTTTPNVKDSSSSFLFPSGSRASNMARKVPSPHVSFRSSLPDLSSPGRDNKDGRRRFKGTKGASRKDSSEDETSSLIDESERCLRSSIDLLLTDELHSPTADYSVRSATFGLGSTSGSYLYKNSRKSRSQPILTDENDELYEVGMGSPFLPRKLSEMRVSRWAKVILPGGRVAVVGVTEMDELRDTLTIRTDAGCLLTLPFRKVVFAWKNRR